MNDIVRVYTKYDAIPHLIKVNVPKLIKLDKPNSDYSEMFSDFETVNYGFISIEDGLEGVKFVRYRR